MKWSKEIPKEDGFYWVKYFNGKNDSIEPAMVENSPFMGVSFLGEAAYFDEYNLISLPFKVYFGDKIEVPK